MTPPVAERPDLRVPAVAVVGAFAVWIVVQIVAAGILQAAAGSTPRNHFLFSPYPNTAGIVAYVALVAATLFAARRTSDRRAALGLVPPRSWGRALPLAAAGLVFVLAVGAALEPVLHGGESQGLQPSRFPGGTEATVGVGVAAFAIVLVAPFAEELFFRGAGYAALRRRLGRVLTALVTAAIFGAVHLEPRAFPVLALVGLVNAALYERTGSIYPGMALHAANNGLAFAAAFLAR